jgi:hypothetical protein
MHELRRPSVTTRVLNAIPRENADDYRRLLNRKELPVLKRKRSEPRKNMCAQFATYYPATNTWRVQLARYIEQPTRFFAPKGMDPRQALLISRMNGKKYARLRDGISATLELLFPKGLPLPLSLVEFVRLSPRALNLATQMDGDNVPAAFKPVRDGFSRYARDGAHWRKHKDTLGQADGWVEQQGTRWNYRQQKCSINHRLMGIQIILHCAQRAAVPSPDFESSPTS